MHFNKVTSLRVKSWNKNSYEGQEYISKDDVKNNYYIVALHYYDKPYVWFLTNQKVYILSDMGVSIEELNTKE